MLKEFREFISKGNVMDLAVGIIIGAAFTAIVTSFVKDLITPLIGAIYKANFENLFLVIRAAPPTAKDQGPYTTFDAAQKAGAVTLNYGSFLNAVINFLLVAVVLFVMVKVVNKLRREPPPEAPAAREPTQEEVLLTEIRDLLAKRA